MNATFRDILVPREYITFIDTHTQAVALAGCPFDPDEWSVQNFCVNNNNNNSVPDTFADAHVVNSAREAGAAAEHAATNKTSKYSRLTSTHIIIQWSSKRFSADLPILTIMSTLLKDSGCCHHSQPGLKVKEWCGVVWF